MNHSPFIKKVLFFGLLIVLAMGTVLSNPAAAAWPTKEITLIVPYKPGGGFDIQSRIFAPVWEKHLPQKASVVIANRPGAGGKIGSVLVMKAPPDGYTIGTISMVGLAMIQVGGELEGYDIRDLNWVGQLSIDPGAVIVSKASGIKTHQDLFKREIRIGAMDEGLFSNALMAKLLGLKWRKVVFDGSGEQALAAMRGDIDLMTESWTSMKRAVESSEGKLVPLFVLADRRLPGWPEVPCSKELKLDLKDCYAVSGGGRLLAGPAGIPKEVANVMKETIWKALQDPEFKTAMEKAKYDHSFVAPGSEASKTVADVVKILEDNKDIFEILKSK